MFSYQFEIISIQHYGCPCELIETFLKLNFRGFICFFVYYRTVIELGNVTLVH